MTAKPQPASSDNAREPGGLHSAKTLVLVLNHRRDSLDELIDALRSHNYRVEQTLSLVETHQLLARRRPSLVILNPLVLHPGSVELELLEDIQHPGDPVPVILLVDSLETVHATTRSSILIRDFLARPHSPQELLHRIELMLSTRDRILALQRRATELEGQVSVDFKTGLSSARHFETILAVEFKRAQRHTTPLSLLLVDVDDFKAINDSTEYSFGDQVLAEVASALKQTIRATDYAARFGGDEFVLLLPQTTPQEAVLTAERVREAIDGLEVSRADYLKQVTVSLGIGTYDGRSHLTPEELRSQANKALKEAKNRGKNRAWLYAESGALEFPGRGF